MKRQLKRGESYKDREGTIWEHDRNGNWFAGNAKRRQPAEPREFEVSDAEYRKNPGIWVPTEAEKAETLRQRKAQEEAWHAARGKEMSDKLRETLGFEDKEVKAAEEPKRRGRPPKVEAK